MNWKPIFAFLLLDSFLLLICHRGNVQVSVFEFLHVQLPAAAKVEKTKWISLCQCHAKQKIVMCKIYNFSFPIDTV